MIQKVPIHPYFPETLSRNLFFSPSPPPPSALVPFPSSRIYSYCSTPLDPLSHALAHPLQERNAPQVMTLELQSTGDMLDALVQRTIDQEKVKDSLIEGSRF